MTKRLSGTPVDESRQIVHRYLYWKDQVKAAQDRLRLVYQANAKVDPDVAAGSSDLIAAVLANGTKEESGNWVWEFEEPVLEVTALEYRQGRSISIDEDVAQELAERKGLVDEVTHTETVWDYEEFYRLNQEGKITDEELDSLLHEDVSWSLHTRSRN